MRHFIIAVALAVVACGSSAEVGQTVTTATTAHRDQATLGKELYAHHCEGCHGARGQGSSKAPALVGAGALPLDPPPGATYRKTQFRTAQDLFDFMKAHMPLNKPGSLTDEDYEALVALALKSNGVDVIETRIDRETAPNILLHSAL